MSRSYSTHYKEAFKETWEKSARKEAFIKVNIELHTGLHVIESGFGAGSTKYIPGASGSFGHEKAAPDFTIEGTNVVIEVTGPLDPIDLDKDLLINLSKVEYAQNHPDLEYWVAHSNGLTANRQGVRMIRVGQKFDEGIGRGTIVQEHFEHRNVLQMFWAVPPDHHTVCTFDLFLLYLRDRK